MKNRIHVVYLSKKFVGAHAPSLLLVFGYKGWVAFRPRQQDQVSKHHLNALGGAIPHAVPVPQPCPLSPCLSPEAILLCPPPSGSSPSSRLPNPRC